MSYDYRVTQWAVQTWHTNFVNAQACCNQDLPVYNNSLGSQCNSFIGQNGYYPYPFAINSTTPCPPRIIFQCYGPLTSVNCNQVRSIVYPAMGLSLATGEYTDCSVGGKLMVGSQSLPLGQATSILVVDSFNSTLSSYSFNALNISSPSVAAGISAFVSRSISSYGSTSPTAFLLPYTQIENSILVDGIQANVSMSSIGSTGQIAQIGDQWAGLFDFPGMGAGCPNTSSYYQFYLMGQVNDYRVVNFDMNQPQRMISNLSFYNSSIQFAQWLVTPVVTGRQAAQSPQLNYVTVSMIQSIQVKVGMVPQLGACYSWMLAGSSEATLSYGPALYTGPLSGLNTSIPDLQGAIFDLNITVNDVSAPLPIELPSYGGMWYLAITIGMGAIWLFGLGLFILCVPWCIWQSVRINKGLPPLNYRANRRFRGW